MNFFPTRWLSDSVNKPSHVPARLRKLGVEFLEDRTVPSITIPDVADITGPVQVVGSSLTDPNVPNAVVNADSYNPQTVLNPVNPNQIVTVFTQVLFGPGGIPNGTALGITTSNDRGQTWVTQTVGNATVTDPLTGTGFIGFTDVDSPSVAFDRAGNLYVAYIQRNLANTSGVLVLDKFSTAVSFLADPVNGRLGITNLNAQRVLYRYTQQDPIFNPVVGVNNLLPTFTDPGSGQVNTNFAAGRGVYVAWNTAATQTGFTGGSDGTLNRTITPSVIQMVVSDDGGASFSTPQFVSDNGFQVGSQTSFRTTNVNPQVYFTQNSVTNFAQNSATKALTNGISGGRLGVSWETGITQTGPAVVAPNTLTTDVSDPLNGNAANPLTVQFTTPNFQTGSAPNVPGTPTEVKPAVNTTTGQIADAGTPTGGVLSPRTTTFDQTVTLTNIPNFTTLADLNVTLAVFSQDLSQMKIELMAPNGTKITLLNARQQLDGNGALQTITYGDGSLAGLPGGAVGGLGEQVYNVGNNQYFRTGQLTGNSRTGLVFDQQAARLVNDPANLSPYILSLRPETFASVGGQVGLDRFNGLTAAQLTGSWKLLITNYKENDTSTPPITRPNLDQWTMTFVSRVNNTGYGTDNYDGIVSLLTGTTSPNNPTAPSTATNIGTAAIASPVTGTQGWYSVAVDNTNGSVSPYQGRTYLAYTAPGGGANDRDIFLVHSDDGGVTWSTGKRVNDDLSTNDFGADNRNQFQPQVTVDQATGTVVVMWYDARWDASNGRVATFMATSVDGGDTFSPNTYLNFTKSARDAIDRSTVKIEPLPTNLTTMSTRGFGFGVRQGLVAYSGTIVPVWTGNNNVNPDPTIPSSAADLRTALVRTAAGPRVLQGDMGPISDSFAPKYGNGAIFNDTVSIDGTRQLNGFYVRFDRAVDPASFTAADVQLRYRDTTGAAAQDISSQVLQVVPLDDGGTRTYNYPAAPATGTTATSVISVGLAPAPNYIQAITVNVSLGGGQTQNLTLTLTAPDGTQVTLANGPGGPTLVDTAFANTTFDDTAPQPIALTQPPYVQVRPTSSLTAALRGHVAAGDWTLTAVNGAGVPVTIKNWSLNLTTLDVGASRFLVKVVPQTAVGTYSYAIGPAIFDRIRQPIPPLDGAGQNGNAMDQNGNGVAGEKFTKTFSGVGIVNVPASTVAVTNTGSQSISIPVLGLQLNTTYSVKVHVSLTGTVGGLATLRLIGPDGTTVTLYDQNVSGSANQLFANTTFDDQSANTLAGSPANTQIVSVQPFSALSAVQALNNGTWTLQVTNREGAVLTLQSFSLDFTQNTTDVFANPTSATSGIPFTLPYATNSLPLIIPGPRVAATRPGQTLDGAATYLDIEFDRDMRSSSFTPAQVLELRTPQGTSINSGFTVIPNPPGTDPKLGLRTFRVTFPAQSLSGYYSLLLGPGILSATGLAMDPNMNAGVELVTGRVVNPAAGKTVSVDLNTGLINGTGITVPVAANATTPGVATATLQVTDPFFLTQQLSTPIQVRLNINVPDTKNLSAQLIAPDGTIVQLFTNPGRVNPPTANFTNTVLNDFVFDTTNLIQNQGAPFTGTFLPQQPLSVLNGKLSAGTWTLRVFNKSTTQTANIQRWGLSLPKPVLSSGLGEPVADNTTLGFKVFASNPNLPISTTAWTPLGPTQSTDFGTGEQSNGVVTVTAVDPSDPTGNTVYAGSSHGGLWKTSNFLTLDAAGPTWIPLLDAASAKALRISSIAIIPRNNDPTQQSIVLVGTGEPATSAGGVGFLRSTDGGRTFRLIDSTSNADQFTNILPVDSAQRDHLFSKNNSYVYKVVVDQVRQVNGEFYMYAAVGGDAAVAGLWRSVDSGRSWVRQMVGECTDFVLASNRLDLDPVTGNPALRNADIAYAAFATSAIPGAVAGGVYTTQNIIGTSPVLFNLDVGAAGKPLFSNGNVILTVGNSGTNPNKNPTRILLAAVNSPAVNDPNGTRVYQGWLYALVIGGTAPGLYMTKDFGANWVLVRTQVTTFVNGAGNIDQTGGVLTNDETLSLFNFGDTVPVGQPRWNSLAVDPTDPNVVYIGATNVLKTPNGSTPPVTQRSVDGAGVVYSDGGVFRVDVSTVNDAHAQVGADNSAGAVGPQVEAASTGGLAGAPSRIVINSTTGLAANNSAWFNRIRDPNNPFITGATQIINGTQFTNNGFNAQVSRFRGVSADALIRGVETYFDPLTRKTRVIVSTDRGVFSAVDGADPLPTQGIYANAVVTTAIGSATVVNGNRSSNLALADVTSTGIQPSGLAGDLAGLYNRVLVDALGNPLPTAQQNSRAGEYVYSVTDQGYLNGPAGILSPSSANYGQDKWRGEITTDAYLRYAGQTEQWRYTGQVATDPQGSGTIYQYRPVPYALTGGGAQVDGFGDSTDIFFVTLPGQAPIGRSNGLFNTGLGNTEVNGIWATTKTAVFSVNPGDKQGIVIGSPIGGQVFLTTDQGLNWFNINGTQAQFNNSPTSAIAFGGRESGRGVDDFIYNGTTEGKVWVTRNAGGTWTDISAGLPTGANARPILKLIPNPRQDTYELYAITATGVFYKADARTTANWVNLTGNLFRITRPVFGETTVVPFLTQLTSLAVDWRYASPTTTPVLYVGGDSGVYRATTGTRAANPTWSLFPAMTGGAAVDGGYLPTVRVTDLDLVYGSLNPTGVPDQSTARNVLVASTYGRGLYSIRLDPSAIPADLNTSGPWVNTTNSPVTLTGPNAVTGQASFAVTFGDPDNTVVLNRVFLRIDPTTLNSSTMSIVGPNGIVVPFTVTDVSGTVPGSVSGESLANKFRIDFTPPTTGNYQLRLNTGVRDVTGRPMNQNQDGVNGQQPQDYFLSNQFAITVNQPPTITGLANVGLLVGVPSAALPFTVGDAETPAGSLTVTVQSSNTTAVPLANVVLGGSGANRTVTVTGAAAGSSVITLTVTDGGGRQTSTSFTASIANVPSVPFSDNFNRPDTPDLGGQWVLQTGTAAVSSNSGLVTSPLAVGTVTGISQTDSVSQARVTVFDTGNSSSTLIARYSGPGDNNMYIGGIVVQNGVITANLVRYVNGTATIIGQSAPLPSLAGYVIRLEVVKDSLKLFVNGQLAAFAFDTGITGAGKTGFRVTQANRFDDFSTDNIVLNPVSLPPLPGQTATETFTGADGTQLNRNWQDRAGNLSIINSAGNGLLAGQAAENLSTFNIPATTANEGAQVDVQLPGSQQAVGIVLRYSGTPASPVSNLYWGGLSNLGNGTQAVAIWRNLGGTWTQLAATTLNFIGGTLRFEANGPSLKLFVNDTRVLTAYDTQLTAGQVGLRTSTPGGLADNFFAFALGSTATLPASDTFSANPPRNQLSSQWIEQSGAYSVAGNAATAQVSSAATGKGNTAVLNGVSAADVTVAATVGTQVGGLLSTGLVARYTGTGDVGDTASYYWGALNVFGSAPFTQYSAQIWKVVNGAPTFLQSNATPILPANAVGKELRFEVVGSTLKLFLNNQNLVVAFDSAIAGPGSVGMRTDVGAVLNNFTAAAKPAQNATLPFKDTFNSGLNPQNSLSTFWTERAGVFSVATNRATAQDPSGPNLAVLNGLSGTANATVTADLFFTGAGQTAGLVTRYQGASGSLDRNLYFADLTTLANGNAVVRIGKDVNGVKTTLAQTTLLGYFPGANFSPAIAPKLRFVAKGTQLLVYLDNLFIPLLNATDSSFATGSIGIRATAGAAVDNFNATSP